MAVGILAEGPDTSGIQPSPGRREPPLDFYGVGDRGRPADGVLQPSVDSVEVVVDGSQRQSQVGAALLGGVAGEPYRPDGRVYDGVWGLVELEEVDVVGGYILDDDHGDVDVVRDIAEVVGAGGEGQRIGAEDIGSAAIDNRQAYSRVVGIWVGRAVGANAYDGELVNPNVLDDRVFAHYIKILQLPKGKVNMADYS
jgi:hypothetical protein